MSLEEMWKRLAAHQPLADARGYGEPWALMCEQRTEQAARAAADSAAAARAAVAAAGNAALAAEWAVASSCWAPAWAGPAAAIDWIERAEGKK